MRLGKLDPAYLDKLLQFCGAPDPSVSLGPRVGEDAGAIKVSEGQLLVASDPVTLASREIGTYAVHINANDVAASGGIPRWFLSTILLPEFTKEEWIAHVFQSISKVCHELGVSVLGGHTEVTSELRNPIVCGTMIGTEGPKGIIRTGGARLGDTILLTKGVCIEGTALLALEREEESRYVLGDAGWKRAADFLHEPGISIVRDARIALENVNVHAMHDLTEGGLLMGAIEMARASGLGIEIDLDPVPLFEESRRLCEGFAMDPYRTLASGALLVCVSAGDEARLLNAYNVSGVKACAIGSIVEGDSCFYSRGLRYPLHAESCDEVTRAFDEWFWGPEDIKACVKRE